MKKITLLGIMILSQTFLLYAKTPQLAMLDNSSYSNNKYNTKIDAAQKNFKKTYRENVDILLDTLLNSIPKLNG